MKTVQNVAPGLQTVVALEEGNLVTGTVQNCDAIAEWAKAAQAAGHTGPSGDMKHAARVPFVFVEAYLNRNGITMQDLGRSPEHQRRLLNDPALAHFRVWRGQV